MMSRKFTSLVTALGLAATWAASPVAVAATSPSQAASIGLKSTLERGIVSIQTDPVLADGRLVLKVVAHNPTSQPLQLTSDDVHVFTAAGKAVRILSLNELIAEAKGSTSLSSAGATHQASNYSRPQTSTSNSGEMDVSGISGASDAAARTMSELHTAGNSADDPAVQQQVDALKAGILQTATVDPGKATGGQLVTEKIRFSRKEERALRVVVDFNGEHHEFSFEAPPAK